MRLPLMRFQITLQVVLMFGAKMTGTQMECLCVCGSQSELHRENTKICKNRVKEACDKSEISEIACQPSEVDAGLGNKHA